MIFGYCRVSSKGQQVSGTSLEDQQQQILFKYPTAKIVNDTFSGMKERPVFNQLLTELKEGDTLVVTKLDRFCRSASDGIQHMSDLTNRGIKVDILDLGLADTKTPSGKLVLSIFQVFAEFEANMILSRTKAGKDYKRANDPNWRDGRKKIQVPDFLKYYEMTLKNKITVALAMKELGISYSKWYRLVKEQKLIQNSN